MPRFSVQELHGYRIEPRSGRGGGPSRAGVSFTIEDAIMRAVVYRDFGEGRYVVNREVRRRRAHELCRKLNQQHEESQ